MSNYVILSNHHPVSPNYCVGSHNSRIFNMRRILEKFVIHFNDLYSDNDEIFVENEGRKY